MRMISRGGLVSAMVALGLMTASMATASAADTLDSFCSESGDFCTYVIEKDSGAIQFQIRAFANYFGRSQACVTKETQVCRNRAPHRSHGLFVWRIRWQDNFPDEGPGRYTLRWRSDQGARIGPALYFRPD